MGRLQLGRRAFLQEFLPGAALVASCRLGFADERLPNATTLTYKVAGLCKIKADVFTSPLAGARPIVLWIHGGALIMGNRQGIDRPLRDRLLKAGYSLISIDYRLAPETKLPAILEDVEDAYRWARTEAPKHFSLDSTKIAAIGGSAGGYLTLSLGYRVVPRPQALVSFWGYGDIAGAWYSRPDLFYCRSPLVPAEEARHSVGNEALADAGSRRNRYRFYLYSRQQGRWPLEVTGHDPDSEPALFKPWCPLRNVSSEYPPTLLIHGTKDTDVPYEQSQAMAAALRDQHVTGELITIRDGGHGFGGVAAAQVSATYDRVLAFLEEHLR